jgi:hypothetical protein
MPQWKKPQQRPAVGIPRKHALFNLPQTLLNDYSMLTGQILHSYESL